MSEKRFRRGDKVTWSIPQGDPRWCVKKLTSDARVANDGQKGAKGIGLAR